MQPLKITNNGTFHTRQHGWSGLLIFLFSFLPEPGLIIRGFFYGIIIISSIQLSNGDDNVIKIFGWPFFALCMCVCIIRADRTHSFASFVTASSASILI